MAGRFPLYTDADVRGTLIKALRVYSGMTSGEILEVFEALAVQENPFSPYPIVHVKPRRRS